MPATIYSRSLLAAARAQTITGSSQSIGQREALAALILGLKVSVVCFQRQ